MKPDLRSVDLLASIVVWVAIGAVGCHVDESSNPHEGGTDESGGGHEVTLSIPQGVHLCANSQVSVRIPDAFTRYTELSIPPGTHALGVPLPWPFNEEDGSGEVPPGTEADLGATVRFPNVAGDTSFRFGSGRWAVFRDRDLSNSTQSGVDFLYPVELPRSPDAPLSAAVLIMRAASEVRDGELLFVPPRTSEELDDFEVFVGCSYLDLDTCTIGTESHPLGISIELVPCSDFGVTRELAVSTERGTFRFMVESQPRIRQRDGVGLLRSASGDYMGIAFEQFALPELAMARGGRSLPGYGEEFGVRFDAPIAGACGVLVENLDFESQTPLDPFGRIAYEISCEGERGSAFEVLEHAWTP
jgi:hypothetical protein